MFSKLEILLLIISSFVLYQIRVVEGRGGEGRERETRRWDGSNERGLNY